MVLALSQKQRRQTITRMLLALVVLWGTATYFVPSVVSQFGERLDPSGSDIYSDYGRLWSAVYAVVEISQKPVIGWGIDHLDDAGSTEVPWTGEVVGAHNTFLRYWHGAGLLGAIGFLAIFCHTGEANAEAVEKESSRQFRAGTQSGVGLLCYVLLFIVANLGPFDYNRFLYIPLFIFAGFAATLPVPLGGRSLASDRNPGKISGSATPAIA